MPNTSYVPQDGQWSVDTWGDNMVATGDEKPLYIWQKALGVTNVMQIIGQAPDKNLLVAVSPVDQHMLLLGTVPEGQSSIDPMYVRWCDQGNYNVWGTEYENTAGGVRLTQGDRIIARIQSGQNTLVWTNTSMYRVYYVGPPRTFGTQPIASVGIIGQNAAIEYRGISYWMTQRGFYQYNGTVNNIPCDVRSFVIENLSKDSGSRVFASVNKRFNEVWWFFPSEDGTAVGEDGLKECDAYVALNVMDGTWHKGRLSRSAMYGDSSFNDWPYATAPAGELYDHERGMSDNGDPMGEYLETYDIDLPQGGGGAKSLIKSYVPDFPVLESEDPDIPELKITLKGRTWSQMTEQQVKEFTIGTNQAIVKARLRARQVAIRIEGTDNITDWRMSLPRLDVNLDGER